VRQRGQQPERERETGIEAGIPGFQGNKKQPNSDRWNAAATTTTKTGLETKKKNWLCCLFTTFCGCCTEKNVRSTNVTIKNMLEKT